MSSKDIRIEILYVFRRKNCEVHLTSLSENKQNVNLPTFQNIQIMSPRRRVYIKLTDSRQIMSNACMFQVGNANCI